MVGNREAAPLPKKTHSDMDDEMSTDYNADPDGADFKNWPSNRMPTATGGPRPKLTKHLRAHKAVEDLITDIFWRFQRRSGISLRCRAC